MSSKTAQQLRILLVEDDPLIRWTGRKCLEKVGHLVHDVETCAEALESWPTRSWDLAIVDYRLPDGSGTDLISRVRNLGSTDPIICLTGESESIPEQTRIELSIQKVLDKPVDLHALRNAVMESVRPERDLTGYTSTAAPRTSGRTPSLKTGTFAGRFEVLECGEYVNESVADSISDVAKADSWLALDMTGTNDVCSKAVRTLTAVARRTESGGGRFCMIAPSPSLRARLTELTAHDPVDIASDTNGLVAMGRRITTRCERNALLGAAAE